LVAK
jgi:hypothetical protein